MTDDKQERVVWLSVGNIASRLDVHEQTVRRWIRDGELPAMLIGGKTGYRVKEADLIEFEESRMTNLGKAAA